MAVNQPGSNANPPASPAGQQTVMGDAFSRAGYGANAPTQDSASAKQQSQGRSARRSGGTLFDVNSRLRRPIPRHTTGEAVQAYLKTINKHMEETMGSAFKENFQVHVLDNNSNAIALSAILITYGLNANGQDHLAVFTMVVEGSATRLANRFINIGGTNVEIDTVAGDVVDRTLWDKIATFLTETYGKKLNLHNAGALVLPTELSAEDAAHIHRVVFQVTQALYTVMENDVTGGEEPITVSLIDSGSNLTATVDYNPAPKDNAVNLPQRNDVEIVLRGQMAGQGSGQGGINSPHEQIRDITVVGGYIDLVYSEPQQPQGWGQPQVTQKYFPRLVITHMDSQVDAITPETQLLALSSATLLSKNMAWGGAFVSRYVQGGNLRDIGAIGYEVNLSPDPNAKPERIDTSADSFGNQQLFQLLQVAVHDALIYSMDVDEVGELAWLNQMFIAAANGDQAAYEAVYMAADRLTEGHFSRVFAKGEPIAVDDQNRVILGYYEGSNGEHRDVREIDYLAMLNLMAERDMNQVINWSRSLYDTTIPLELRLEQQARILKGMLPTLRIKGYARRITFNPNFVLALNQAAANAGLVIRPQNMLVNFQGQQGRGNYQAASFAVAGQQGMGGLFNYTQPAYGGYRGVSGPFTGRFGMGG